ncbi:extracellular solute-binding protein [Natronospora cellulosivora (SeqCode)]
MKRKNTLFISALFILLLSYSVLAIEIDLEVMDIEYNDYLESIEYQVRPEVELIIPAYNYIDSNMKNIEVIEELEGRKALGTDESGFVEWEINVPENGLYNIELEYYPLEGRGGIIEREIHINNELLFQEAQFLEFPRIWHDESEFQVDNQGNHIRSPQVENPRWQTAQLRDAIGYVREPYSFYFEEGVNTIRFYSRREPMAIGNIRLFQYQEPPAYEEVIESYLQMDFQETRDILIKIDGQDATYRSSQTLYPAHDQGDPTVEPYHPAQIRLNTIGGHNWDQAGQWVAWEFEVPESGLYKIGIKGKQNIRSGTFSNRKLYINDQIPFRELEAVRFNYSSFYDMVVPSDENGEAFLVYLEEGTNTIKLEAVLGDFAEIISRTNVILYEISSLYRSIIMITTRNPDRMRTYRLAERIPGLVETLLEQSARLDELAREIEVFTGESGEHIAVLSNLAHQLRRMAERPDERIPNNLDAFRDNIGNLGNWIMHTSEQPLQIDYLLVASPEMELPKASPSVFQVLSHEASSFVYSFFYDYTQVGNIYEGDEVEPLNVWISGGRDQAQTLKNMIEDTFTPQTGIPVNLELIQEGVILPATLAGRGPDVALRVSPAVPINFYIRNAILDLSQFDDFPEVASRFHPSALVPFQFRDSYFALPEEQSFPVLFYRKDILHERGLTVPQTWDEVVRVIAELQKDNMNFGLPYSNIVQLAVGGIGEGAPGAGSIVAHAGVTNFLTFLYQRDAELYQLDGIQTNLESEEAIEAFTQWTELYELYDLPLWYDYANYFRLGEMPLMITGYPFRNHLEVFAPELRGKWGFTLVPGTVRKDGSINRTVPSLGYGTANQGPSSMIMADTDDKEAAWEFLKWWTSAEIQTRFGHELESIMGTAARYPTANMEALGNLPWRLEELDILMEQWQYVKGLPEVPGGYMVGRHLDNAFRQVIYAEEPPRETLLDYNRIMNRELRIKRDEFNLELEIEDLPSEHQRMYWNYLIEN